MLIYSDLQGHGQVGTAGTAEGEDEEVEEEDELGEKIH